MNYKILNTQEHRKPQNFLLIKCSDVSDFADTRVAAIVDTIAVVSEKIERMTGVKTDNPVIKVKDNQVNIGLTTPLGRLYASMINKIHEKRVPTNKIGLKKLIENNITYKHFPWNTSSTNIHHILNTAIRKNLDIEFLGGDLIRVGQGKFAQIFDSTCTIMSSRIGAKIAKNKDFSAIYAGNLGLPTIPSQKCSPNNYTDVIKRLNAEQYPVVVKPNDLDRGIGIKSHIYNKNQLISAVEEAFEFSNKILIQPQLNGNTYRFNTLNGEIVSVLKRRKAYILGDGERSFTQLLDDYLCNEDYKAKCARWGKQLIDGDKALQLAIRAGVSVEAVLAKGETVDISLTHNANAGAETYDVDPNQIHPSFIQASLTISNNLNLDFLGLDWITTNVEEHWKDSGAKILEINTQPQIGEREGGKTYSKILEYLQCNNIETKYFLVDTAATNDQLKRILSDASPQNTPHTHTTFIWKNKTLFKYNGELLECTQCDYTKFKKICSSSIDCHRSIVLLNRQDASDMKIFSQLSISEVSN
ncbi:hypothetical protein OAE29_07365 [Octadecabacter sp.]|nr:hypothetical protein [Octadecabacter sp.]